MCARNGRPAGHRSPLGGSRTCSERARSVCAFIWVRRGLRAVSAGAPIQMRRIETSSRPSTIWSMQMCSSRLSPASHARRLGTRWASCFSSEEPSQGSANDHLRALVLISIGAKIRRRPPLLQPHRWRRERVRMSVQTIQGWRKRVRMGARASIAYPSLPPAPRPRKRGLSAS